MNRADRMAQALRDMNIPVLGIEYGDETQDHELTITEKVSVQVGAMETPYVIVNAWVEPDTMEHWPTRKMVHIDQIAADVLAAIAKTGEVH